MRKDKEKVLDEVWTKDRIKGFLNVTSYDEVEQDFHMLLKAYQSMRASDFASFVDMFSDQGRSLNATNPGGETVLSIVLQHRKSSEYVDILRRAGAV